jgi:hypothetical protein
MQCQVEFVGGPLAGTRMMRFLPAEVELPLAGGGFALYELLEEEGPPRYQFVNSVSTSSKQQGSADATIDK